VSAVSLVDNFLNFLRGMVALARVSPTIHAYDGISPSVMLRSDDGQSEKEEKKEETTMVMVMTMMTMADFGDTN
jgi:hypothetical protein